MTRPPWGGRAAAKLTAACLALGFRDDLGYTPCHWCGRPAGTADHWPVARIDGGLDHLANLVPACRPCNSSRGATAGNLRRSVPPTPTRRW